MCLIGRRNTWAEEVDYWLDPKTNQMNPQVAIYGTVESGKLEATVTEYARGFLYLDPEKWHTTCAPVSCRLQGEVYKERWNCH